jgi:hypothetical protein
MPAPINTYDSATNLNLGQVPTELESENEALYRDLLDIHNALEILLTSSDDGDALFQAFIDKFRNFSQPAVVADYTVLVTDGIVRVDASVGDITVTMHPVASGVGYRYPIKRIDTVTANKVTLLGDGTELIDERPTGINLSTKSSYTLKANDTGWDII